MLYKNITKQVQSFYQNSTQVTINPGALVDSDFFRDASKYPTILEPSKSLFEFLQENPYSTVCLYRSYALGDIIMAYAACRYIKKYFKKINLTFVCPNSYYSILKYASNDIFVRPGIEPIHSDYSMSLDGIMEKDHELGEWENKHRINIILETLGFPKELLPKSGDDLIWGVHLGTDAYAMVDSFFKETVKEREIIYKTNNKRIYKRIIGLQVNGSGKMKSLPLNVVKNIAEKLTSYGDVFLISNNKVPGIKNEHIFNITGLNLRELGAFIQKCDFCITMDSGPLWIAHLTKTPTIVILGPTYPEGRITLHPKKCLAIETEKWIKCKPCGERAEECSLNYSCLQNINENFLWHEIQLKIDVLMSGRTEFEPIVNLVSNNQRIITEFLKLNGGEESMNDEILSFDVCKLLRDFKIQNKNKIEKVYSESGKLYEVENLSGNDFWIKTEDKQLTMYDPLEYIPAFKFLDAAVTLRDFPETKIKSLMNVFYDNHMKDDLFLMILKKILKQMQKPDTRDGAF